MLGTDPEDVAAFRRATGEEPMLRMESGISEPVLAWLRKALAHGQALARSGQP